MSTIMTNTIIDAAVKDINKLIIITSEKSNNQSGIPYVASQFGVETLGIVAFFKQRGIII